jgi:hypothetical protein
MSSTTQLQNPQDIIITISLESNSPICLSNEKPDLNVSFDSLLLGAVDSAFSRIGPLAKHAFYFHLESCSGVSREAIPENVEAFVNALEQIFGVGALLIEVQIIKALKLQVPQFRHSPGEKEMSFLGYLESMRSFLQTPNMND